MLRRLVAVTAAVAALSVLPTLPDALGEAQARDFTPWQLCLIQAEQDCYPLDSNGNPRPPNLGDPTEQAAYEACTAVTTARCNGLPGDPNG